MVTLVGFDPATAWIADSTAGEVLWHRCCRSRTGPMGPALNPLSIADDSQIVYALQNLPSVDLPPIEQLFLLLVGYIALIGPINYLILRRLDKREWAWVTIPALVVVFAFGSYGLGATLKGSDVIVNQIAVVRAAQGTGRGIGQAYIGIYSPTRRTFDVRIPGGALLSNPTSLAQFGQTETPLDVLFGDSTRGCAISRSASASCAASAPRRRPTPGGRGDLRLAQRHAQGTVTNRSDRRSRTSPSSSAAASSRCPRCSRAKRRRSASTSTSNAFFGYGLSERIFGSTFPRDAALARTVTPAAP